jgi:hypothetical protein
MRSLRLLGEATQGFGRITGIHVGLCHQESASLRQSSVDVATADAAYDYCLTVVRDVFPKRDTFMAISDLARSIWLLASASTISLLRFTNWLGWSWGHPRVMAEGLLTIGVLSYLAWRRMIRFRNLSDVTVFRVFLAIKASDGAAPSGENGAESD